MNFCHPPPNIRMLMSIVLLTLLAFMPGWSNAAPGDILASDSFERTNITPWTTTDSSRSGISSQTANTADGGTQSLYLNAGTVTVTSPSIDIDGIPASLDIWIRRGADSFSEDTDAGEDLTIQYLDDGGSWQTLVTYLGSGTNGQVYNYTSVLPSDASHASFQIRFSLSSASGAGYDYWHVDTVEVIEETDFAPPLAIGGCDEFENGLSNWTVTATTGAGGVSTATANSGGSSMYLNGGAVTISSDVINTNSGAFSAITVWVQRGSDTFSENPETGEDLTFQYLNSSLTWTTLETFTGNGTQGQEFDRTYGIAAAARHANFQLRFVMTTGSGTAFDFWHIDDVCLDTIAFPELSAQKTVSTQWDPVNDTSNPKAIPGAIVVYSIELGNAGDDSPDSDTVSVEDEFDTGFNIYLGDFSVFDTAPYTVGQPISFTDGSASSGLSLDYGGLSDGSDDVEFLNAGGGVITPSPDANGYDTNVRGIRITPSGTMNHDASGLTTPSFSLEYRGTVD